MAEPSTPSGALQPAVVFRSALAAAAAKERGSRTRRPERLAAVRELTDGDLARLVEQFETLLHGPADAGALAAALHEGLRALSPEPTTEEASDA